ncbi:alpha/beta fold hydrolase [Streptomyces sp. NPDC047009]|uniref:alpha/beta fold hydrolase n=1 Tax=Streptomyces sp. NPDC047009 TaxID=3154496 RepID=UPI00340EEAE0
MVRRRVRAFASAWCGARDLRAPDGQRPPLTLLHGYPASSHQWAKIAPELARRHTLVMPDFLGFGASAKPREHDYSLIEQADLVEALWAHDGLRATRVVAHDYGSSVAQELLARRSEGSLSVALADMALMNGGIYPEPHRRTDAQSRLLSVAGVNSPVLVDDGHREAVEVAGGIDDASDVGQRHHHAYGDHDERREKPEASSAQQAPGGGLRHAGNVGPHRCRSLSVAVESRDKTRAPVWVGCTALAERRQGALIHLCERRAWHLHLPVPLRPADAARRPMLIGPVFPS